MEFSGEKLTFKRIFNYIFGLFLITLGVAFSIKSYALNLIWKIDLGITTFAFQLFLVILQLMLLRSNFEPKHFLQVIVSVIFGFLTSISMALIAFIPMADNLITALFMSAISIVLIALGLFFYVPANIVPISVEGITQTIAIVLN